MKHANWRSRGLCKDWRSRIRQRLHGVKVIARFQPFESALADVPPRCRNAEATTQSHRYMPSVHITLDRDLGGHIEM
jgi:hypothetical protein